MRRELVERARWGDRDAFATLAAGSIGRLFTIAQLMLRDRDLADDAVQEALVFAWRDLKGLRDPDWFDAWLHRVLVRCVYREANRERRPPMAASSSPEATSRMESTDLVTLTAPTDLLVVMPDVGREGYYSDW